MANSRWGIWLLVFLAWGGPVAGQEIPLSSIVSTSGQKGLQGASDATRAESGYVYEFGNALGRILKATDGGASNAFLVDAPGINEAVSASVGVIGGGWAANVPATLNQPDPPRGRYWLVVYLGSSGSSPAKWIVDRVDVDNGRVRFSYHNAKLGPETADVHQYYYWIPLGELSEGVYNLELYDVNLKAVTLARRVEILPLLP